ncbi:ribose-5-phosphate isomerase A, partial [Stenotrophomonas sp. NPDC077659]|uniref:ribose-5-phosphate isomerase A n=1 Tax=Stenotrophomonas sp. NPDC077659 TaxID=3390694 RepID=UPI003D0205BF
RPALPLKKPKTARSRWVAEKLERELNQLPGVVCVGLFARRRADVVIVGGEPPVVL